MCFRTRTVLRLKVIKIVLNFVQASEIVCLEHTDLVNSYGSQVAWQATDATESLFKISSFSMRTRMSFAFA